MICTPNFAFELESSFSNIFRKKWKNDFVRKNQFSPLFYTQNDHYQFSRACSHYDAIVRSYINGWYLLWYQWKEDVHTYTLVANEGFNMTISIDNPGGCNNSPFRKCVWENSQENKGLSILATKSDQQPLLTFKFCDIQGHTVYSFPKPNFSWKQCV